MPILMMALVALLVFGIIGFLLAAAVILEQSEHKHTVKSDAEHSMVPVASPSLNPKLR